MFLLSCSLVHKQKPLIINCKKTTCLAEKTMGGQNDNILTRGHAAAYHGKSNRSTKCCSVTGCHAPKTNFRSPCHRLRCGTQSHRRVAAYARHYPTGRRGNWHCRGNNQRNCTDCKGWKTRLFSSTGTDDRYRRRSACDSLSPTSTTAVLAGIFIALYPRRCPASSCDPHGKIRLFCRYWLWDSIYDSHRLYLCFSNLAPV